MIWKYENSSLMNHIHYFKSSHSKVEKSLAKSFLEVCQTFVRLYISLFNWLLFLSYIYSIMFTFIMYISNAKYNYFNTPKSSSSSVSYLRFYIYKVTSVINSCIWYIDKILAQKNSCWKGLKIGLVRLG